MGPKARTSIQTVTVMPESNEWHASSSSVPERFSGTTEMQTGPIVAGALGSVSEPVLQSDDAEGADQE